VLYTGAQEVKLKILKNIEVPTGNICIMQGEKGKIEFLSIGDYGKSQNIKADFLGFSEEINGVEHCDIMPLEEKWVTTISTQYGCSMNCRFCDVPKVGKGVNATLKDLSNQVINSLKLHPEVKSTKRFNLHYARMGEPSWNFDVIKHAKGLLKEVRPFIGRSLCHPVVINNDAKKQQKVS
jgi:23S rRNA (adenine2503-C2)-methyltransferase